MRSARQAAMANAGLASGTQIYNTRTRQVSNQSPTHNESQYVKPSGSEARLGDILVSILNRLTSLEEKIASLHPDHVFQLIEKYERESACRDRDNSEYLAHVLREVEDLSVAFRHANHHHQGQPRCATVSPPQRTSPTEMRPRSCLTEWNECVVGLDRELRPGSSSSVGTNGFGYNNEANSDMASPTPSETRDIERSVHESGIDGGSLARAEEVHDVLVEQLLSSVDVQNGEGCATREVTIEISGMVDV